jgi:hypothetical protein
LVPAPPQPSTISKNTDFLDTAHEVEFLDLISPNNEFPDLCPGQMFYMDFGFPRGKGYEAKDEFGRLLTSVDGYRSYLLIIDLTTCYIWIMLSATKKPPTLFLSKFFEQNGLKSGRRIVRTDQGGELWGSYTFRETVIAANYILEPTAPGAPFQNAIAERPNQTLGNWMRCALHGANLGPEYWSFALVHVVKVYNMLPHSRIKTTPHFALSGTQPEMQRA